MSYGPLVVSVLSIGLHVCSSDGLAAGVFENLGHLLTLIIGGDGPG